MKAYQVVIPSELQHYIQTLHPDQKKKIRYALEELSIDPYLGKILREPFEGLYSYRVSLFRIIYKILNNKLELQVIDIDKREVVYLKLEKNVLLLK
ncbi:MAG: type II toxin-antitoxin system RelE/ParE family toxin [Deltaproteobacteria bacterium]|nr:type II toxin-antitoxin system RelE/ParE family toxin [Deltaproteobacteria bacterium]